MIFPEWDPWKLSSERRRGRDLKVEGLFERRPPVAEKRKMPCTCIRSMGEKLRSRSHPNWEAAKLAGSQGMRIGMALTNHPFPMVS